MKSKVNKKQKGSGSGYYLGLNDCGIGGQAEVKSYSIKCPPVYVGELLMKGGKKNSKKKIKKKSKKKIKKKI